MKTTWLITYDIRDDRVRDQVAQTLEGLGERRQYSVFVCTLSNKRLASVRASLTAQIDESTDSIRWYTLCAWCRKEVKTLGTAINPDDPGYTVV